MGDTPLYTRTHFPYPTYPDLPPEPDAVPETKSNLERSDELSRMSEVVMVKLDAMVVESRRADGARPIFNQVAKSLADTVRGIEDDDVLVALLLTLYRH